MPKQQRVTIKEIAEEARVSLQTVSRVLNNRPDVAPRTRHRIQTIIAAHNYQPSSIARGITQGRSYILGVISASLEHFGPARCLMGIERRASELGYTVILRVVHHLNDFDINAHLKFFTSQHIDGLLWLVQDNDTIREGVLQCLPHYPIPIIFSNIQPHPELTLIGFDNDLGAQKATEHLIEQGYQHIGHISGPLEWGVARQRQLNWQQTVEKHGLTISSAQMVEGDWSSKSGERCMAQLLQQYPALDAVFVGNDLMALGVMKTARKQHIRIPEDLAIVGYDDVPEAQYFYPPLTTVRHDFLQSAAFMVDEIDRFIGAENTESAVLESRLFEPELVIRESSPRKKRY